jgi:GNAT superfamily N-acetyltransferase
MTEVRPMTAADVGGAAAVVQKALAESTREAGRRRDAPDDDHRAFIRAGLARFVEHDPDGAWVAADGERLVGMANAIRRGSFWGLSMLFVDPTAQSSGIGRRLMDAAGAYGADADVRMILSSSDPRALRRYSRAGLAIHPAVEVAGQVDRSAEPALLPGRGGDAADLDLVAAVDAGLRGSRADDVAFLLSAGARMEITDARGGRGFVVHRGNRVLMLGATDEDTAARLLWRFFAEIDGQAEIWCLTAQQDWAVRVALDARLAVEPGGALFVSGRDRVPGPWIPSGWYF